jgi:hypothetical protein
MVKHLRVTAQRGRKCPEGCPHEEARGLWSAAMDVFGHYAGELTPRPGQAGVAGLRGHRSSRRRAVRREIIRAGRRPITSSYRGREVALKGE